jgi:hypothetical protein
MEDVRKWRDVRREILLGVVDLKELRHPRFEEGKEEA